MSFKAGLLAFAIAVALAAALAGCMSMDSGDVGLHEPADSTDAYPPAAHAYGNVLINRMSSKGGVTPVVFSHWAHRVNYSCRVCHFELKFEFRANQTEITEADNRDGQFCGACHNGTVAFGHTKENCSRCHGYDDDENRRKFIEMVTKANSSMSRPMLPKSSQGNSIDWSRSLLSIKYSLDPKASSMPYDSVLELAAEAKGIPPAYFPHGEHVYLLDCANCHPDIFNIKKKTTKHFSMRYITQGLFCGVCHGKVAFPVDDCERCHPAMKGKG